MTTDYLLQHRNGIIHVNLLDFIRNELPETILDAVELTKEDTNTAFRKA